MLVLPKESRRLFKEPFGISPGYGHGTCPELIGRAVYSVGDVVTHNLQKNRDHSCDRRGGWPDDAFTVQSFAEGLFR